MSVIVPMEKINVHTNIRRIVHEPVAKEAPINICVNNEYVITLLATPHFLTELSLGWLFSEGVLQSLDEVKRVNVNHDVVNVITKEPVKKELLKVVSVSRLITTACGLSADKFFKIIGNSKHTSLQKVDSTYSIEANTIIKMIEKIDEGELFQATGGLHVAALFENTKLVALAEDIGRHNTIDKVVGISIQSKVAFNNSVLVSSGRQPADMVLKAARMGIPIVVSKAAPIRSGIIAAEKTGVTLVCFVRNHRMNVYTHHERILTNF